MSANDYIMSSETVNSWIFLSLSSLSNNEPITLASIIEVADGINHAVPTDREMKQALGWLKERGLIVKSGSSYSLTSAGMELRELAKSAGRTWFNQWDFLKQRFSTMDKGAEPDAITAGELDEAYRIYRKSCKKAWR